jgi:hypothetical protein
MSRLWAERGALRGMGERAAVAVRRLVPADPTGAFADELERVLTGGAGAKRQSPWPGFSGELALSSPQTISPASTSLDAGAADLVSASLRWARGGGIGAVASEPPPRRPPTIAAILLSDRPAEPIGATDWNRVGLVISHGYLGHTACSVAGWPVGNHQPTHNPHDCEASIPREYLCYVSAGERLRLDVGGARRMPTAGVAGRGTLRVRRMARFD